MPLVLQASIDLEASQVIGAELYERHPHHPSRRQPGPAAFHQGR
jgi:hypothetical protein